MEPSDSDPKKRPASNIDAETLSRLLTRPAESTRPSASNEEAGSDSEADTVPCPSGGESKALSPDSAEARNSDDFTVLAEIGRGGMGVVYRARQHSLEREVALKRSRSTFTAAEDADFLREARVTGFLEHPNIVPVHAIDRDRRGASHMAMKLIRGEPWSALLAQRPSRGPQAAAGLEGDLEILLKVCDAVAFAHSKGIAHCDLKPANVMVGGYGEVLLMDWGVAVSFDEEARNPARPRGELEGSPFGSPRYMAPEQARGQAQILGPATDVYALGAILEELILGRPPEPGSGALERVIARHESRGTDRETRRGKRLDSGGAAALSAIALRALRPEPERRHASALEFRGELAAYLRHRESIEICDRARSFLEEAEAAAAPGEMPLTGDGRKRVYADFSEAIAGFRQARHLWEDNPRARRGEERARLGTARAALRQGDLGLAAAQLAELPSSHEGAAALRAELIEAEERGARARRKLSRLRAAFLASLAAIVLSLAVGLASYVHSEAELRRQNEEISRQARALVEEKARLEAARARADAERARAGGREAVARESLSELILAVGQQLQKVPGAGARAVRVRLLERALIGVEKLIALSEEDRGFNLYSVQAQTQLGDIARQLGQRERALAAYREACRQARAALETRPEDPEILQALAIACERLGRFLLQRAETEGAAAALEEACRIFEALGGRFPEEASLAHHFASAKNSLANVRMTRGRVDEALVAYAEVESALLKIDPPTADTLRALSMCYAGRAEALRLRGRLTEALGFARKKVALQREILAPDPLNINGQKALATALWLAGGLEVEAGSPTKAREYLEESAAILRRARQLDPEDLELRRELAVALDLLGKQARARGALSEARKHFEEGLAEREESHRLEASLVTARDLMLSTQSLYDIELAEGRLKEAGEHVDRGLALAREQLASGANTTESRLDLAAFLSRRATLSYTAGRILEGEASDREAIASLRQGLELGPKNARLSEALGITLFKRGQRRRNTGDLAGAEADFIASIEALRRPGEPSSPSMIRALIVALSKAGDAAAALGRVDEGAGRIDEALRRSRALLAKAPGAVASQAVLADALMSRAKLHAARREPAEARAACQEAVGLFEGLSAASPTDLGAKRNLSIALLELAELLVAEGKGSEALALYRRNIAVCRAICQARPGRRSGYEDLAAAMAGLGDFYRRAGQAAAALKVYDETLKIREGLYKRGRGAEDARQLAGVLVRRGATRLAAGDKAGALTDFRRGREVQSGVQERPNDRQRLAFFDSQIAALEDAKETP